MVKEIKAFSCALAVAVVTVFGFSGCAEAVYDTVFQKQLLSLENIVSVPQYLPDLAGKKDDTYTVKVKSFRFASGNEYVAMLVDFNDMNFEDTLLVFSSSLRFLTSYTKPALVGSVASSYEFSTLLGMGTGDRILVGLEKSDGTGLVAALDPKGVDAPILQASSSDYLHFAYTTSITDGTYNYVISASSPNLKIGAMDSTFASYDLDTSPSETAKLIQVFQSTSSGFILTDAAYYPGDTMMGILLRTSANKGYAIVVPAGTDLTAPIVGSYQSFTFSGVQDSNSLFYTRSAIVNAPSEGTWYCVRLDGVKVEGPKIESWDSPRTKTFAADGTHYYYFDDVKLNLGRAKTWW